MYDVVVIGGGPAGYAAALYCARAGLQVVVLETMAPGGQMGTTAWVENYPGFPEGVGGFELAQAMQKQAEHFGARTLLGAVEASSLASQVKRITAGGKELEARAVVVASGAAPRELGLPNERALRGKGVSYCATCDGMFYRGKKVLVVGGGDTAAADAVYLSKICKQVVIVHRRDKLRASAAYTKPLQEAGNVRILWDTVVQAIPGERVERAVLRNVNTGQTSEEPCDGVFIAVGNVPNTAFLQGQLALDTQGYILAGEDTRSSLPGVFAAGDVRRKPLRQIVTAVADGAVAAAAVEAYLAGTNT